MSFNLDYYYNHLPERFRRADGNGFLKRFMQPFCEELDNYDAIFEAFHEEISPDTASEEFIDYFLWALFGWGWFPRWFTLARKREFYRNIATHYARRGTERGIREFLAAFGVHAFVQTKPLVWGEFVWGEPLHSIAGPLGISVSLSPQVDGVDEELSYWGEFAWGEGVLASPSEQLQQVDVDELLRFEQPLATVIMVETLPLVPEPYMPEFIYLTDGDGSLLRTESGDVLNL